MWQNAKNQSHTNGHSSLRQQRGWMDSKNRRWISEPWQRDSNRCSSVEGDLACGCAGGDTSLWNASVCSCAPRLLVASSPPLCPCSTPFGPYPARDKTSARGGRWAASSQTSANSAPPDAAARRVVGVSVVWRNDNIFDQLCQVCGDKKESPAEKLARGVAAWERPASFRPLVPKLLAQGATTKSWRAQPSTHSCLRRPLTVLLRVFSGT